MPKSASTIHQFSSGGFDLIRIFYMNSWYMVTPYDLIFNLLLALNLCEQNYSDAFDQVPQLSDTLIA